MVPSKREVKVYLAQKTNIPYNSKRGKVLVYWIIDVIQPRRSWTVEEAFKGSRHLVSWTDEDCEEQVLGPGAFVDYGYLHGMDYIGSRSGEAYYKVYYVNGSWDWLYSHSY